MPSILIKNPKGLSVSKTGYPYGSGDDDLVRPIKRLIVIFRKSLTRNLFGRLEVIWIYKKKRRPKKGHSPYNIRIVFSKHKMNERELPKLNWYSKSVLIGTLLGDACILASNNRHLIK
jgi:hypothetical protein